MLAVFERERVGKRTATRAAHPSSEARLRLKEPSATGSTLENMRLGGEVRGFASDGDGLFWVAQGVPPFWDREHGDTGRGWNCGVRKEERRGLYRNGVDAMNATMVEFWLKRHKARHRLRGVVRSLCWPAVLIPLRQWFRKEGGDRKKRHNG